MSVFTIALSLFLITNPIGNTPSILALVKDFPPERQRRILLREAFLSMCLAMVFLFVGDSFLRVLQIQDYTMSFTGGIILVLVALGMIFPSHSPEEARKAGSREPFLVPIATPILIGGGALTTIMLFAREPGNFMNVFFAILISSAGVATVMFLAPTLQRVFGRRGMLALEQLMGMILLMMSTELIVKGMHVYINSLKT